MYQLQWDWKNFEIDTHQPNLTSKLTLTIFSYSLKQPQEKMSGY